MHDIGFSQNIVKCLTEKTIITSDTVYTSKWGNTVFMKYFLIPIVLHNEVTGIWANLQDLTDLWQTQTDLIKAKEKAEESDKLKTAFLNNISHEFRTPLNAIAGFSEIITMPNHSQEKLLKFSGIIAESSNKLIEIVTDVIEISQIQAKQISIKNNSFDFIQLINELTLYFKPQISKKGLDFIYNINSICPIFNIYSDKDKLHKIIKHLIDNAVKFTHHGSVIVDFFLSNEKIEFTVTDTGIGISKEMQQIIFEPFRQIETGLCRNYGGNGVGLAIIKGFIELLSGTITMQSVPNVGTQFNISIPILCQAFTDKILIDKVLKNKKIGIILIVDDEQSNYEYLFEILQQFFPEILYAANGQQAIDICRANTKIDLVLMDIKMPIMEGHTATKLIKAFRPELTIIAQTAYALDSDKERFLESGFDDYICKPIRAEILFATIDKYINR